ncbi:uncharacterized protein CLAFUR5_12193 [Fulvia fulva]|uniref:Uncharacterized protein n=1 Tax=Passalora fulva TaxID=5499 RepID=A0A9Q8UUE7_PASFU|nr:uncharacterized protein CLAFUR5_12193 [Fulvia fulva]UJO22869.1 hypothetical protein CLAFUR5_12193 [Fulvia fulva]
MSLSTHWLGDEPSRLLIKQNFQLMAPDMATESVADAPVILFQRLEIRIAISLQGEILYFNDDRLLEISSFVPGKSIKDHVLSAIQDIVKLLLLKNPQFVDLEFDEPLFQATPDPEVMRLAVLLTVDHSDLTDAWIAAHISGYSKHHFTADEDTASSALGHILGPAVLARFRQFNLAYMQSLLIGTPQQKSLSFNLCRNTLDVSLQVATLQTKVPFTYGVVAYIPDQLQRGLWLISTSRRLANILTDRKVVVVHGQQYSILTIFVDGQVRITGNHVVDHFLLVRIFLQDGRQNIGCLKAEDARIYQMPVEGQPSSVDGPGELMDTSSDGGSA